MKKLYFILAIALALTLSSCSTAPEPEVNPSSTVSVASSEPPSAPSSEPVSSVASSEPASAPSSELLKDISSSTPSETASIEPRFSRSGWDEPEAYNIAPISDSIVNEAFIYMGLDVEYVYRLLKEDAILGYKKEIGASEDSVIALSNGIELRMSDRKNALGRRYISEIVVDFYGEKGTTKTATALGIGAGATEADIIAKLGEPQSRAGGDGITYYLWSSFWDEETSMHPPIVKFFFNRETKALIGAVFG